MSEERVKRKLSAILSADVVGYSRLMQEDEVPTIRTLEAYRKVMSDLIEQFRGRVVDSPGDNLLSEFSSVVDAVQCAVEIHEVIRAKNEELPEDRRMLFRIGINLGDVIEEGDRIYGDGVNIAARLEGLAEAGGICISGSAHEQIKNKLALGYEYIGEHTVKNISEPLKVYRVPMGPKAAVSTDGDEKGTPLKKWRWTALGAAGAIVVIIGALAIWNSYLRGPSIEPASVERMAYPLPDKPSIAVLPFNNMSGNPEQDYIGDGLSENIISALSVSSQLFVIARNSTFTYKGKAVDIRQVAEDLGVQYILEGSVQKSEERLRVTAQFIDALTGHHLWAEVYDREMNNLFDLQDEITKKIMVSLQVVLSGSEEVRVYAKSTDNLEAWKHYIKGVELFENFNEQDHLKARERFETALEFDPVFIAALSKLAETHVRDYTLEYSDSPLTSINRALEFAQKAVELDEQDPCAHSILGQAFLLKRQYAKAITAGKRAITLNPNYARGHVALAGTMHYSGRFEEAITLAEKAYRLNSNLTPVEFNVLATSYIFLERYEEALETIRQMAEDTPPGSRLEPLLESHFSWVYHELGREEEAALVERASRASVEALARLMEQSEPSGIGGEIVSVGRGRGFESPLIRSQRVTCRPGRASLGRRAARQEESESDQRARNGPRHSRTNLLGPIGSAADVGRKLCVVLHEATERRQHLVRGHVVGREELAEVALGQLGKGLLIRLVDLQECREGIEALATTDRGVPCDLVEAPRGEVSRARVSADCVAAVAVEQAEGDRDRLEGQAVRARGQQLVGQALLPLPDLGPDAAADVIVRHRCAHRREDQDQGQDQGSHHRSPLSGCLDSAGGRAGTGGRCEPIGPGRMHDPFDTPEPARLVRAQSSGIEPQKAYGDNTKPVPIDTPKAARIDLRMRSAEGGNARLGTAEDQRMDVVRALVGIHRLEVHAVADHMVFVGDAISAVHVAGDARDRQGLAAIVALEQGDGLGCQPSFVHQAPGTKTALQPQRDLRLHVGELQLDQLIGRQRPAELLALERVAARGMPAEFGRAHRAPGDAVAGLVETAEGAAETADLGEDVLLGHEDAIHHDLPRDRGAQGHLARDLRKGESLHPALDEEAADLAVELGPDHADIGDRAVGDPRLAAREQVAPVGLLGARAHAAGIRAVVRLGEAEAAHELPACEPGEETLALGLRAVGVDRMHDQRGLHAHRRAIARVDPLDLARDQSVGHVRDGRTAIALGQRRSEQSQGAHLSQDLPIEALLAIGHQHARHQLLLRILAGGCTDQAFVFVELLLEKQRIRPVEGGPSGGGGGLVGHGSAPEAEERAYPTV